MFRELSAEVVLTSGVRKCILPVPNAGLSVICQSPSLCCAKILPLVNMNRVFTLLWITWHKKASGMSHGVYHVFDLGQYISQWPSINLNYLKSDCVNLHIIRRKVFWCRLVCNCIFVDLQFLCWCAVCTWAVYQYWPLIWSEESWGVLVYRSCDMKIASACCSQTFECLYMPSIKPQYVSTKKLCRLTKLTHGYWITRHNLVQQSKQ